MVEWLPVPLNADQVVVRRLAHGDEAALVELFTDAKVRRYLGGPLDLGVAEARATRIIVEQAWGGFVIAAKQTGVVVGGGDISRKRGPWELSYQLLPAFWRAGLASDAVRALIGWFFAHTVEDVLIAVTQDQNERSTRLLSRAGAASAAGIRDAIAITARHIQG